MNEKSTSHFGVSLKGDAIKFFNVFFAYIEMFLEFVELEGNLNWKLTSYVQDQKNSNSQISLYSLHITFGIWWRSRKKHG